MVCGSFGAGMTTIVCSGVVVCSRLQEMVWGLRVEENQRARHAVTREQASATAARLLQWKKRNDAQRELLKALRMRLIQLWAHLLGIFRNSEGEASSR
jgi:hypothetical protein